VVSVAEPLVEVGREAARRAAAEELSRSRYSQEPLLERVWRWFWEGVVALLSRIGDGGAGGVVSLVLLVAVLAGLAALLVWSLRRMTRTRRTRAAQVFADVTTTADEHRRAAEEHAREGRWAVAVQERVRALARSLEERDILSPAPGRTTDELAAEAGLLLPTLGTELTAAARLFDAVTYGEHPGRPEDYATMCALDDTLQTTAPILSSV
jgi:type II secretory pathway pseudopilin PulG